MISTTNKLSTNNFALWRDEFEDLLTSVPNEGYGIWREFFQDGYNNGLQKSENRFYEPLQNPQSKDGGFPSPKADRYLLLNAILKSSIHKKHHGLFIGKNAHEIWSTINSPEFLGAPCTSDTLRTPSSLELNIRTFFANEDPKGMFFYSFLLIGALILLIMLPVFSIILILVFGIGKLILQSNSTTGDLGGKVVFWITNFFRVLAIIGLLGAIICFVVAISYPDLTIEKSFLTIIGIAVATFIVAVVQIYRQKPLQFGTLFFDVLLSTFWIVIASTTRISYEYNNSQSCVWVNAIFDRFFAETNPKMCGNYVWSIRTWGDVMQVFSYVVGFSIFINFGLGAGRLLNLKYRHNAVVLGTIRLNSDERRTLEDEDIERQPLI